MGRITEHSEEQVVFLGEFREDVFAVVKAQMKGRKIDKPVDLRLIHRSHKSQVYDGVIDGASIASNYRAQITSIIRDVSYVGLVNITEGDRREGLRKISSAVTLSHHA